MFRKQGHALSCPDIFQPPANKQKPPHMKGLTV